MLTTDLFDTLLQIEIQHAENDPLTLLLKIVRASETYCLDDFMIEYGYHETEKDEAMKVLSICNQVRELVKKNFTVREIETYRDLFGV
jgi:hypothetical protein